MKPKAIWYDKEEDVLGIQISGKGYWKSVEVADNVVIDISREGEIIGIEILKVKESLKESAPLILRKATT